MLVPLLYDWHWYRTMTRNTQPLRTSSQLGQLLRSARKAGKVTQAQLALRMGVSQSRVSQLELQPGDMTVDQLLSACAAVGLELHLGQRHAGQMGKVPAATKSLAASLLSQSLGSSNRPPLSKKEVASIAANILARKPRKGAW